jgi:hypothetical protein
MKFLSITKRMLQRIVSLEKQIYKKMAWKLNKFSDYMTEPDIVGRYLEAETGEIMGYFIFEDTPDNINILNLTVNPKYKEGEVFKFILDHLKSKLDGDESRCIRITVRDDRLSLQWYLHTYGMEAKLLPKFFSNGQDGITFTLRGGG